MPAYYKTSNVASYPPPSQVTPTLGEGEEKILVGTLLYVAKTKRAGGRLCTGDRDAFLKARNNLEPRF